MKKLMTMIAAVATAFGLFAAEMNPIVDTVDFSNSQYEFTTDAQWTYNGAAISTAPADKVWVANSLLNLATGSNKVERTFKSGGAATITDAIYFDANINFEDPFDEAPVISDSDNAKIAAFVLDNSEALDEIVEKGGTPAVAASTNLYAIAAYYNGETWEKRAFMFVSLDEDDLVWNTAKRLTIKAYGDVMAGADTRMGFRFFLNGDTEIKDALKVRYVFPINDDGSINFTTFIDARDTTTPYLGEGVKASLEAAVRSRCSDQTLVLGLTDVANELVGFDLAGKGELAKFTLTTTSPEFIDGDASTVALDLVNTEVTVTGAIDYDQTTITFAKGETITVTATYDEGKSDIVKWTKNGTPITPTDDTYSWAPNNNDILAISAKAAAAFVDVNGTVTPYETINAAITAVKSSGGTLKLATDAELNAAEGKFQNKEIVIDLAGNDIASTQTQKPTILVTGGQLTIIDTVGGGTIADSGAGAIENDAKLIVAGGIINGAIATVGYEEDVVATIISNGTFNAALTLDNTEATTQATLTTVGGNFVKGAVFGTEKPTILGVPESGYDIVDTEVDGYWTVIEDTAEYVAEVVVTVSVGVEETNKFETAAEALAAVQAAELAGQFPIWVKALADEGLTITSEGNTAKIAKNVSIGINKVNDEELWVVDGTLEYSGTIDGKVDADEITMPQGTSTIALGVNAIVTVYAGTALTEASFTAPTGYMVKKAVFESGASFVQFTVEEIAATVKANGATEATPYASAEDALAAVQELEKDDQHFPITVTAVQALTLTFGEEPNEQSISLAAGETIEITADSWKFDAFAGNVVLAPGKTIRAKSIADGATITTIDGYKVVKSDTTDEGGYYTWSVEEKTYVAQIGDDNYETFAEAWAAANVAAATNTIELLADDTVKAALSLDKAGTAITVNFNEKTLTFDITSKYAFQIKQNNAGASLTLNGGTLAAAAKKDGSNFNQFIQCYQDVTLDDMTLDVANMDNSSEYSFGAAVNAIMVMNGTLTISGTTKVINVPADNGTTNIVLSIGNHAANPGAYVSRKVVFDLDDGVTFNNAGNVRLCGGTLDAEIADFKAGTKFYYGACINSNKTTHVIVTSVFADSDVEGLGFAARAGKALVAPTDGDYYQAYGQLYTDLATAVAAMGADEEVAVYGDQTVAAATFTAAGKFIVGANKVTVTDLTLAGTKIELAKGGEFTNAAVTESDFVAPAEGQKLVNNAGIWTVKDIEYATLTIETVENLTISVTNAAGEAQSSGATFDKDLAIPLYVTRTPDSGYVLDGYAATETITMSADVTVTGAVKSAVSPQPFDPTKDVPVTDPLNLINDPTDTTVKAKYLKAPEVAVTTEQYLKCFDAIPGSAANTVKFVLNATGSNTVATAEAAANADALEAVLAATEGPATLEIATPVAGFYYSLKQSGVVTTLDFNDPGDANKLATGKNTITFELVKPANAGFYQAIVTPVPVETNSGADSWLSN